MLVANAVSHWDRDALSTLAGRNGTEPTCVVVVEEGVQARAIHGEVPGVDNAQTPTDSTVSCAAGAARRKVGIMDGGVRLEGD